MRRPDFFIVGFGNSGTTSLYHYLREHPDIYMSPLKETDFFCSDLRHGPQRVSRVPDLAAYEALFEAADQEKAVGEASPLYIVSEAAAEQIHAYSPGARIVILVRDPVDYLVAWHAMAVREGHEPEADFARALALEAEREAAGHVPIAGTEVQYRYRWVVANMPRFVGRYISRFGRERVLVIPFDRLRDETAQVYREVLGFLGVAPEFAPHFEIHNSNRLLRMQRWPRLHEFFQRHRDSMRRVRSIFFAQPTGLRSLVLDRLNRRVVERPSLDPELRRSLEEEFASVVWELRSISGIELPGTTSRRF